MNTTNNGLGLKIPSQIFNTLPALRNAAPDRGMKLASMLIKIDTKENKEAAAKAAEDYARKLIGNKVDEVV